VPAPHRKAMVMQDDRGGTAWFLFEAGSVLIRRLPGSQAPMQDHFDSVGYRVRSFSVNDSRTVGHSDSMMENTTTSRMVPSRHRS
jgi:hypothetical protein